MKSQRLIVMSDATFHFRDSEFGNTVFPQDPTAQFKEALTTGSTYLS